MRGENHFGVLVASDAREEWLLPWWWSHYSRHNSYPVTFVDFGMTEKARSWCQSLGEVVPFTKTIPISYPLDPEHKRKWEEEFGPNLWDVRSAWFKKPFAMQLSPYEKTIWIDLDCEILGSLSPLFGLCNDAIAIAKEPAHQQEGYQRRGLALPGEVVYNSGVIVFKKEDALISKWADETLMHHDKYLGDENVLSRLIFINKIDVVDLPDIYNWRMVLGVNLSAQIVHWVGDWGKAYIRHCGGIGKELRKFQKKDN